MGVHMEHKKAILSVFVVLFAVPGPSVYARSQRHNFNLLKKTKWHEAVIRIILNDSAHEIELVGKNKKEMVQPGTAVLKQQFDIPFASIKTYIKHLVDDMPYIPTNALKIKTHAGIFGVWEDERGILYCKEKDALDDNGVQKLLDVKKLKLALALTLKINQTGSLDIVE